MKFESFKTILCCSDITEYCGCLLESDKLSMGYSHRGNLLSLSQQLTLIKSFMDLWGIVWPVPISFLLFDLAWACLHRFCTFCCNHCVFMYAVALLSPEIMFPCSYPLSWARRLSLSHFLINHLAFRGDFCIYMFLWDWEFYSRVLFTLVGYESLCSSQPAAIRISCLWGERYVDL